MLKAVDESNLGAEMLMVISGQRGHEAVKAANV